MAIDKSWDSVDKNFNTLTKLLKRREVFVF